MPDLKPGMLLVLCTTLNYTGERFVIDEAGLARTLMCVRPCMTPDKHTKPSVVWENNVLVKRMGMPKATDGWDMLDEDGNIIWWANTAIEEWYRTR